jgi:UDP-3-O-acyl N-acetylglucosamine deacetylase
MINRLQRTIARRAEIAGTGFLTGAEIRLKFLPERPGHGIAFLRTDRLYAPRIPATIDYVTPRPRRTAIERSGVSVEMIEHVMAALAGLHIDNCLVEVDGSEPPGCDGSSRAFVECLLAAGIVEQDLPRQQIRISQPLAVRHGHDQRIEGAPSPSGKMTVSYALDYGAGAAIPKQSFHVVVTPETFVSEIAFARTFLLYEEALALKAQGYGKRTSAGDLLVFGPQGVIDNTLRTPDECARHKILDCIGDLALAGCDISGCIEASRSGHQLNAEFVRNAIEAHRAEIAHTAVSKAA